ncbi:hypothetical protein ACP70R_015163 [Stipagrostis hirtigluma subsp. patula]
MSMSDGGGRNARRMEHGQTGEGEVPQQFSFGASIEEIDNSTAHQYGMHGGTSAGTEDCHLTAQESPLPSSRPGKKQAGEKIVAHRGSAFTKEEDGVLCSAFLNVSKDPITGVNQKQDGYYKRIYDYYSAHKPEGSVRSQISLQKRWASIQKCVTKFCACKSAVDRLNESGKNEYDRVDDAVKMYEKTEPFQFMHCWKMLRNEAKWNEKLLELRSTPTVGKGATAPASNPAPASSGNGSAPLERPEGRDSAKRRRAKEDTGSSTAAIEVLQQMHDRNINAEGKQDQQMQEILNMKADKIQLSQKMFELQKQDIENRSKLKQEQLSLTKQDLEVRSKQSEAQLLTAEVGIMGADLEKLSPGVRSYYIKMQHEIMLRRGINPDNNDEA